MTEQTSTIERLMQATKTEVCAAIQQYAAPGQENYPLLAVATSRALDLYKRNKKGATGAFVQSLCTAARGLAKSGESTILAGAAIQQAVVIAHHAVKNIRHELFADYAFQVRGHALEALVDVAAAFPPASVQRVHLIADWGGKYFDICSEAAERAAPLMLASALSSDLDMKWRHMAVQHARAYGNGPVRREAYEVHLPAPAP
ncbi:MAG: hypothetical protein WDO70_09695 [Alphaproteobacteria bacterium]